MLRHAGPARAVPPPFPADQADAITRLWARRPLETGARVGGMDGIGEHVHELCDRRRRTECPHRGQNEVNVCPRTVVTTPVRIGSYRIERLLGVGSFGTVWLGYDASLGARVAIKVLAENWSHDLRVRERFLEEARLLWQLDHERIVSVYALGELPDGRPYSVMSWADGGSLRDRLPRTHPRQASGVGVRGDLRRWRGSARTRHRSP
jgi:protein tyrosine kinase